ncbi:MAG: dihydropyrimidinase [Deltaproteobacteria bacterium]|nr:dihydropyrimidinase [Deltaproteobacteria bacterium]
MGTTLIKNGNIVTATDRYTADILCDGGVIKAIGQNLSAPSGAEVVDASGQYVFPGGVDAHTHMELPFMGTVSADDFYTGTAAGVAGGTTSIIDFIIPNRKQSLIDARDFWMKNAEKSVADYAFHMAVTWFDESVERHMHQVFNDNGITSFKTFMAYTGAIGVDDQELIQIMRTARKLGALVTAHCEHGYAVVELQKRLIAEGKKEAKYHAESRPSWIEGEATHRAITLARAQGIPVYIVHLTAKEALDAVVTARKEGLLVWAETCPQYLLLDDSVYEKRDFEGSATDAADYVMSPPIRPKGHQEALWAGLAAGLIHTVATDHCPFTHQQKLAGKDDFTRIPNGAAGVQDRLSLMWTYGVERGRITPEQFVNACSTLPAKVFNLYPKKGAILVGSDADLVVFDATTRGKISAKTHKHNCDRSIFEGFETKGQVTHTLVRGELAYKDGDLRVTRGNGRYLRRDLPKA